MGLLHHIFEKHQNTDVPKLRKAGRAYFHVTSGQLRARIEDWMTRRADAEQQIADYLRPLARGGNIMRAETPFYKVDPDGYIESVSFQHYVPLLHTGWTGITGTNWLVPDNPDVEKEIRGLTPLPSYSELNELINWPEIDITAETIEASTDSIREFAERANRSARAYHESGHLFLSLPYADTFMDMPDYRKRVENWQAPEGLSIMNEDDGKAYERRHKVGQHALGRTLLRLIP